jgi:hypothetical protein
MKKYPRRRHPPLDPSAILFFKSFFRENADLLILAAFSIFNHIPNLQEFRMRSARFYRNAFPLAAATLNLVRAHIPS